jgi:hypothetical protein
LLSRVVWYKFTDVSELSAAMVSIALTVEAASISETSANLYQTTRRNNPEDSHLHTCRRENLRSHKYDCGDLQKVTTMSKQLLNSRCTLKYPEASVEVVF